MRIIPNDERRARLRRIDTLRCRGWQLSNRIARLTAETEMHETASPQRTDEALRCRKAIREASIELDEAMAEKLHLEEVDAA